MVYAQLHHSSTGWNGLDFSGPVKSIPMCGTEGVIKLDGRLTETNMIRYVLAKISKHIKREYITGFTLNTGRSYSDSAPVTALIPNPFNTYLEQNRC